MSDSTKQISTNALAKKLNIGTKDMWDSGILIGKLVIRSFNFALTRMALV